MSSLTLTLPKVRVRLGEVAFWVGCRHFPGAGNSLCCILGANG